MVDGSDAASCIESVMTDELERSLREFGFLSPFISDLIPAHRTPHPAWFTLAEALNALGQRQMQRGSEQAAKLSSLDPLNICVRLLIRTMSNFQGSMLLIERGMVVEANTLIRNCYENGFWLGAFFCDPNAALEAFKLDETKSQDSRADAFVRIVEKHGDETMQAETRQQFANRRAKLKKQTLGLEQLAQLAGLHPNFAFYKELSASSAHPSLYSIERYLDRNADGDWQGFVTGPEAQEHIGMALNLACHALISALAAFGQVIGASEDDPKLFDLNEQYKTLAGVGVLR
jgi:Family of unknown function (DUF5677)